MVWAKRGRWMPARQSATVFEGEKAFIGAPRINAAIIALGVVAALIAMTGGRYYQTVFGLLAAYIVSACGYNLVLGFSGQMAFGQAGFMAAGAYVYAVLVERHVPGAAAALAGVCVAGAAAAVVGVSVLRTSHIYLALVTLAFAEATLKVIELWPATHGDDGIPIQLLGREHYLVGCALAVISVVLIDRVARSRHGRAIAMVRADEDVAAAMGVNVVRVRVSVFVVSGVMGGLAGILVGAALGFITPQNFSSSLSLLLQTMIIVGGLGSVWGAAVGAIVIVAISQAISQTLSVQSIIYGILLFGMLVALPGGLVSLPHQVQRLRKGGRWAAVRPVALTSLLRLGDDRG